MIPNQQSVIYHPMMLMTYNIYIYLILVNDRHNCIILANDGNGAHHMDTCTLVKWYTIDKGVLC